MSVNILELWEQEKAYRQTEAHHALCRICEAESDRIAAIAVSYLPNLSDVIRASKANTVREEFSINSQFLHRGYYCHSPACDLITTNLRRGRLVKHPGPDTEISNGYGFDSSGRMLWCSYYNGRNVYMTEYLIHQENAVYSFVVGLENQVERFSEEIYQDGRLIRYSYLYFGEENLSPVCCSLRYEEFTYDTEGLASCLWRLMHRTAEKSVCHEDECQFQREDGYLTHYTNRSGTTVRIPLRRKA